MYDYIEGAVRARSPSSIVLETGGVGYRFEVPLSTYERIPATGPARLYARVYIQEDQIRLFGFATVEERRLFEDLIQSASRVGPVKALAVLSSGSVAEIHGAIVRGDVHVLRRIRGIGEKIAQRLVVELKDRIGPAPVEGPTADRLPIEEEAGRALIALGFGEKEAREAIRAAAAGAGEAAPGELVRRALQARR